MQYRPVAILCISASCYLACSPKKKSAPGVPVKSENVTDGTSPSPSSNPGPGAGPNPIPGQPTPGPQGSPAPAPSPGKTDVKALPALHWPKEQILPSFPAVAETQDLFFLHERPLRFEVEGEGFGHKTGKKDGNAWVAVKGEHEANHMIFGPYVKELPTGPNTAEFSVQRFGDAADGDEVIILDVFDAESQKVLVEKKLAARDIKKDEFASVNLPFELKSSKHNLEARVYFTGKSSLKVDWISFHRNESSDELIFFASLKGIVNRQQPRVFSYEGDAHAEGPYTWLNSLKISFREVKDNWELVKKYREEFKGILIFDPDVPDTINLVSTLAASKRALVASPKLAEKLKAEPYNLPVIEDFRGKFKNKFEVYNYLFDKHWSEISHRLVIGLNPAIHLAALREYAVATGVTTLWLDPRDEAEGKILDKFLNALDRGSPYLGWWAEEGTGIIRASERGIATIASDWSTNLTFHSGFSREIKVKAIPPKPALKNKIYVGFIMSDGDNLQFIEHLMRKLWNNPDRGKVPIGWTISPAMVDAMPGALNFYHESSTDLDNLIAGPSGIGYIYPDFWKDQETLKSFVQKTEEYNKKAGLRVVTIWNEVAGATNATSGRIYAQNAPSLLGLTSQNTGGGLTVFENTLPSMALSCNYCTDLQAMKDHVANAAKGWNKNEPRFVMIQAQPWFNATPSDFLKVKESLNADYEVVRPDHFFMLLRESKGLKQP